MFMYVKWALKIAVKVGNSGTLAFIESVRTNGLNNDAAQPLSNCIGLPGWGPRYDGNGWLRMLTDMAEI